MATEKLEDVKATGESKSTDAKRRSALDLEERAAVDELMTPQALRKRQENIGTTRKQAGPELTAPPGALGAESTDAEDTSATDLEEVEDLTPPRPEDEK